MMMRRKYGEGRSEKDHREKLSVKKKEESPKKLGTPLLIAFECALSKPDLHGGPQSCLTEESQKCPTNSSEAY